MKFRIAKITDHLGNDKARFDQTVASRVGRIVDANQSEIMVGFHALLVCENDKHILTTRVRRMSRGMDYINFETDNSVYYLERIKGE